MLAVGSQLAGYRIEGILGHGGMAVVYEARQLSLHRIVALKLLAPQFGMDATFRERFQLEGRLQAGISHPNVVQVFEAGESPEGLYIVMQLIRGSTLKDLIVAGQLDGPRAVGLLRPIADALDVAHEAGLTHRDVKPQNILVDRRDHPFLADFGLTKGLEDHKFTRPGHIAGTVDYVAPELIRGDTASRASDIYALATVLYECLTGSVPFPRPADVAVMFAILSEEPRRIADLRPELPSALDDVIARGMAKDPAQRFASASALIDAAADVLAAHRAHVPAPIPPRTDEEKGIRRADDDDLGAPLAPGADNLGAPLAPGADAGAASEEASASLADTTPAQGLGETRVSPLPGGADEVDSNDARSRETRISPSPGAGDRVDDRAKRGQPGSSRPARESRRSRETAAKPADRVAASSRRRAGARPAPPARRRLAGRRLLAGGSAAVVLAVGLGFVAGRLPSGDADAATAADARTVSGGAMALRVPDEWEDRPAGTALPGITLAQAAAVGPHGDERFGIVAGQTESSLPSLLPRDFQRVLTESPPRGEAIRIGELQALRYRGLEISGAPGRRVTLFVTPTSAGTSAIACFAPGRSSDFEEDCARVAASARLVGARAEPLGPDRRYAAALHEVLDRLADESDESAQRLAAVRTRRGQAEAAFAVARAYRDAADSVAEAQPMPALRQHNEAIASALRALGDGYASVARAARSSRPKAYAAARAEVRRAENALETALQDLEPLGYRL